MKSEKQRLLRLLNSGKISSHDFEILSSAIENPASRSERVGILLVNPFVRIAGFPAFAIGALVLLVMSFFGLRSGIHFPGIFDLQMVNEGSVNAEHLTIVKLIVQNLLSVFILGLAFYGVSVVAKVRGLRLKDFLGTVMLSRYPYMLATMIFAVLFSFGLEVSVAGEMEPSAIVMTSIIAIGALVWQSATYFFAFKESSGLAGKRLWVCFFVAAMSAEVLSATVTRILL